MIMRVPPIILLAAVMLAAPPVLAQVRDPETAEVERPAPPPVDDTWVRAPQANTGRIGQRQTREDAARATGIKPMARISTRINNRVQARLRNRIDRYYDSTGDARSAFATAEDQVSVSTRPKR
ncbi:hypothetical protein CA236_16705 [Sphingomonas sp. ABOLG]|uniref:hypothetical protein n=1 Tax=Sphingomonas sp. ABOLG TaxID=1985880 RepID=UPI000F7E6254|nr:hypothetical protein [Sphingomonas sp. ABOLG]RSV14197.1 hypothetical protein CA236_16705 [Sphingomonas sp. ABOLG]